MIRLAPAGWKPDARLTDGAMPPRALHISEAAWVAAGKPASIEEFWSRASLSASQPWSTSDGICIIRCGGR